MSYNFEVQGGKSYNIPVGGKYCPDDIVITATGGGVSLDVMVASSLPATVVENQIVVITDTTPSNIYVSTNEPTSPTNGDIWVKVAEGEYGVRLSDESPFLDLYLAFARQYSGGAWNSTDSYVGISGAWQQFGDLPVKGTPLEDWTWEQIITLANSDEDCSEWFAVGDTKDLVLTTGEVVPVAIGAFKRNPIYGWNGNAQIAFTFKDCLNTKNAMNSSNTNNGGWDGSDMRKTHMAAILATFPAELQDENAIKTVAVVANAGGGTTTLKTSYDRLRPHSIRELGLSSTTANEDGTVYPYYVAGNRIKKANGVATDYYTRSAITNLSYNFNLVSDSGSATTGNASIARGVALAFDI